MNIFASKNDQIRFENLFQSTAAFIQRYALEMRTHLKKACDSFLQMPIDDKSLNEILAIFESFVNIIIHLLLHFLEHIF